LHHPITSHDVEEFAGDDRSFTTRPAEVDPLLALRSHGEAPWNAMVIRMFSFLFLEGTYENNLRVSFGDGCHLEVRILEYLYADLRQKTWKCLMHSVLL